jgi:hypothetical protein
VKLLVARILVAIVCLALAGCMRRGRGANYFVGPHCHATARLIDCDGASPPRCQKVAVSFDKACEQLDVAKR